MNLVLLAQCSTSSDFRQIIKWVKKHIILTLEEDSEPYRGQSMSLPPRLSTNPGTLIEKELDLSVLDLGLQQLIDKIDYYRL